MEALQVNDAKMKEVKSILCKLSFSLKYKLNYWLVSILGGKLHCAKLLLTGLNKLIIYTFNSLSSYARRRNVYQN